MKLCKSEIFSYAKGSNKYRKIKLNILNCTERPNAVQKQREMPLSPRIGFLPGRICTFYVQKY